MLHFEGAQLARDKGMNSGIWWDMQQKQELQSRPRPLS